MRLRGSSDELRCERGEGGECGRNRRAKTVENGNYGWRGCGLSGEASASRRINYLYNQAIALYTVFYHTVLPSRSSSPHKSRLHGSSAHH
jgi:hypothetical protein